MPTWKSVVAAAGVALACAMTATNVLGQEMPRVTVSAAYEGVVDPSLAEGGMRRESGAHGWSADVGWRIARPVSLVGSVDGSYGSEDQTATAFGGGAQHSAWADMAYLAGTRFHFGGGRRIAPFFQTLAGVMRTHQRFEYRTVRPAGPFENDENFFVVVPGGGMDITFTRRFGMRVAADVPMHLLAMIEGGDDTTLTRLTAGVVARFP